MSSYIADNLTVLSEKHYIRKAGASDYWFDFTYRKLGQYQAKYGNDFCLVLYASSTQDDSYILPYSHVKHLFSEDYLDERLRWVGSISGNLLYIRRNNQSMSISAYYNAFDYLEEADDDVAILREPRILYNVEEKIKLSDLIQHIRFINEKYREAAPQKQMRISETIARPNAITDYLKALHNYTCQICGQEGFVQRNGSRYAETHHLTELHKLISGSLCADNILVVCANCHRKLHYANVVYKACNHNTVSGEINGEPFAFERNVIS